jgi:DNA/RNA endonuclease G (NUC1)
VSAAATLSNGGPLCVINGPVFDAPMCEETSDGRLRLNLNGKRQADGEFGKVKIPRQFFKVIAYNDAGVLRAKAFVVTQEDLLATIDNYYEEEVKKPPVLSDLEVRLYRARIADLEKVTGLDFGTLAEAEGADGTDEVTRVREGLPIEDESALWG